MTGANFHVFFYIVISLLFSGILTFIFGGFKKNLVSNIGLSLIIASIATIACYIGYIWVQLERPPMRTLGETRLWYSFFVGLIGTIIFFRWRHQKLFSIVTLFGGIFYTLLFLIINYFKPETFNKSLMPALQSYWFVPHVVVYILSYSLLGLSALIAIWGLIQLYRKELDMEIVYIADNIVYIGFTFLTLGLLFGALWAKEAWGSYWTWDPKETWAFLTWLGYLLYIHLRIRHKDSIKVPLFVLSFIFVVLIMCWFGINYLPAAQNSVHVYSN